MESYPGELLVGVFPLVFCVDATGGGGSRSTVDDGNAPPSSPHGGHRSDFNRFLDAMAESLMEDDQDGGGSPSNKTANPRTMESLFRGDEGDDDSDEEDDILLSTPTAATPGGATTSIGAVMSGAASSFDGGSAFADFDARRRATNFSFGSLTRKSSRGGASNNGGINTSFVKALQDGQNFFQRARIISVGTRHGFPPSKDPTGEENRLEAYFVGKSLSTFKLLNETKKRPIDGIVPSGWLEKHAAALPSVILVVVEVRGPDDGATKHKQNLMQTLENLKQSLAPKRVCTIQIVGLVQDGVSEILVDQWNHTLQMDLEGKYPVTLLTMAELQQDAPASYTLKVLHKSVRDASLDYYLTQARRNKNKLARLGVSRKTPLLLPLAIRYCFKVAMFYEFQWKQEKSLKFLVESYRYVETYYRYLLQQREIGENDPDENYTNKEDDPVRISMSNQAAGTGETSEEVEMSLPGGEDTSLLKAPSLPEDMVHQCRAIADWINFKILQFGFMSHTEGGLLAASRQWQKHSQSFLNPRQTFICANDRQLAWVDWSFVSRQRLVVGQLLERHPPRALGELGTGDFDEVLLRCSPWRTYQAAAEALLKLGATLRQRSQSTDETASHGNTKNDRRTRYVGALDAEGFAPKLKDELKCNHREKALDCTLRAISLYERDIEKTNKDELHSLIPWNRSGARLHYLAGGTLLGFGRHAEAIVHLEKAVRLSKGWNDLQTVIRKMLIECYENHIPSETDKTSSQTLASMLLDSYFNAEMSQSHLRKALEKFSTISGGGTIKWYRDCFDENDEALPFSFAVTFPSGTHATAGDTVKTSVLVKSNLDYAVHINSMTLLSLAGEIHIPSSDLVCARNADEGSEGGIIVQANTEILLSTQIKLPKDLSQIAIDETGNGGEKEGTAGKGSFAKSARPRTAGITAGAGARLVSEELFKDDESRVGSSMWSLRCLGGKPVRCDGIRLVFYPVHAASSEGKNTDIELTIEKKQPRTEANIKRTPFEEENYVASAWMRPYHLPMHQGPRCLRVLPPLADIVVTNLTELSTNGKAMEGTVNRILLKLHAGPLESCSDIKFKVTCRSDLISREGQAKKILASDPEDEETPFVRMNNPHVRTPVLVYKDDKAKGQTTDFGYVLPDGWALLGTDGQGAQDEYVPVASSLKNGDAAFAFFDVFRPTTHVVGLDSMIRSDEDKENVELGLATCQTDIEISFCYRQERHTGKQVQKRRSRMPNTSSSEGQSGSDLVYLDESVSVLWSAPISISYSPGMKQTQPSGNRHPSNTVPDPAIKTPPMASAEDEMVLIDGERVNTKCTLEAVSSADGLLVDIERIRFEDNKNENAPCRFQLLTGKSDDGLLYSAVGEDPCRQLVLGSKFSLAWTTEVAMKSQYLKGSVSCELGAVAVDWWPAAIKVPEEVLSSHIGENVVFHGPLRLAAPSTCRFTGPPCYIENAPFETKMDKLPSSLRVANPFRLTYHIKNKTSQDQTLKVALKGADISDREEARAFLVSGLANGEISLGPFEAYTLSYIALPTKVGKAWMPRFCVSSERYNTWVIHEADGPRRSLYIEP